MQQAKQSKRKPNKTRNVSFMSKTAQLFSKARIFSFNSASVIANAVKKTAAVKGLDLSEVRDYTFALAKSILGFLLGMAALPQGIRPFGISLLCSMSDSRSVFFTYIGCALSCITYGDSALSSFIVYFMLFAARKAFTESKYGEQLNVRILESAAASTAIGIIRISTSAEHAVYSYIAFLCLACISCAFTYFFSILFNKAALSAARISTKSICSYALMGALVCSLSGVNVLGFDLQLVAACLITLTYAVANGFLHAGIVGFICGIACASPIVSASLGLSGIIAALMFSKSIFASLISFACAFLICGAYSADLGYTVTLVPSVACSCVLFFPACGFLPEALRLSKGARTKSSAVAKKQVRKQQKELAEAFFSLSEMFSKLAEKQKYPLIEDVELAVDKAFSSTCGKCALNEMCYAKRKTDVKQLKKNLYSVLCARSVVPEDFGEHMSDKCIRLQNLCDELNSAYSGLCVDCSKDNRTALLCAQYSGMARLILDSEKRSNEDTERDIQFEKAVSSALSKADIPFSNVCVFSDREKRTHISGISIDKFPFGAEEFKKYIFVSCGVKISQPDFDISEKSETVLRFKRIPVISVEYSQACASKKNEDISGDTVSFLHHENSIFHALLCDGMGSGIGAATASRISTVFMEKLLGAGVKKEVAFELLNNVLLSQSGECFSTVDLFEADLLTGRCMFIKAGAAPTYILRDSKLFKIFSATPPVGILSSFSAESTRFDIEPDDVIIMLSDGVVQNGEDSTWLSEIVKIDKLNDPSVLAGKILEKSQSINTRPDDMSVAVIRVKKA